MSLVLTTFLVFTACMADVIESQTDSTFHRFCMGTCNLKPPAIPANGKGGSRFSIISMIDSSIRRPKSSFMGQPHSKAASSFSSLRVGKRSVDFVDDNGENDDALGAGDGPVWVMVRKRAAGDLPRLCKVCRQNGYTE